MSFLRQLGFFGGESSFNDFNKDDLRRSFQVIRSSVQDYGFLGSEKSFDFFFSPSQQGAVGKTKKPLIPMMISLVPPDLYPSENWTRTHPYPSPAELDVTPYRLGNTRALDSALSPVDLDIFPKVVLSDDPESKRRPLRVVFFGPNGLETKGATPIRWESSDPERVSVSSSGVLDIKEVGSDVNITASTTLPNGDRKTFHISVLPSKSIALGWGFDEEDFIVPSTFGNERPIFTTQVAELRDEFEFDESEHLFNLSDRYQTFQRQANKAYRGIEAHNTPIVKNRKEVVDRFGEDESIRQARQNSDADVIRNQVLMMQDLPPLFMYTNLTEFSLSYEHLISDGNKGRDGFIIEHWGLQQPRLHASGHIGGTYVQNFDSLGRPAGGLTRKLQRGSASYQSFMTLFQIYKNNGYIYNQHDRIATVGSVKIFYDDTIYTGSFENISITESEDKPFDLQYTFTFIVRFIDKMVSIPEMGEITVTNREEDFFDRIKHLA
jgi:hypothetical protein